MTLVLFICVISIFFISWIFYEVKHAPVIDDKKHNLRNCDVYRTLSEALIAYDEQTTYEKIDPYDKDDISFGVWLLMEFKKIGEKHDN